MVGQYPQATRVKKAPESFQRPSPSRYGWQNWGLERLFIADLEPTSTLGRLMEGMKTGPQEEQLTKPSGGGGGGGGGEREGGGEGRGGSTRPLAWLRPRQLVPDTEVTSPSKFCLGWSLW